MGNFHLQLTLLNFPWYQQKATDLKTTMIPLPSQPEQFTISWGKLVKTGKYSWKEI